MVLLTKEEIDYLATLGFKPNDPLSKGFIEAYRLECRLTTTAKNLETALESAGGKVVAKLVASNDVTMKRYASEVTKAILVGAAGAVGAIVLFLFIVSGMIADFRTDRNAGYDLAAQFHMAPTELMKTLSFVSQLQRTDPGFWQWVQRDGSYFYILYQNNGQSRCERRARIGDVEGCFFSSPVELNARP